MTAMTPPAATFAIDPAAMRAHASDAAQLLKALANEKRLQVLCLLTGGEHTVGEINERLDISQSALSQHLAILRDAGLVESSSDAQRRIYRLTPAPLGELDRWLAPYRDRWLQSFDALHTEIARGRRMARAAAANAAFFLVKLFVVLFFSVTLVRISVARFRITQVVDVYWKILGALSIVGLILVMVDAQIR